MTNGSSSSAHFGGSSVAFLFFFSGDKANELTSRREEKEMKEELSRDAILGECLGARKVKHAQQRERD